MPHLIKSALTISFLAVFSTATIVQAQPCDPNEELKFFALDGENRDAFGTAIAVNATTALIGAWAADDNGGASGAAYFFNTSTGEQLDKLLPHDGAALDHFGYAVAMSGDTALIGARSDDDNGTDSGSVYVFHHDGAQWIEVAKLLASDGEAEDYFGASIVLQDDIAVIGAPSIDASGNSHDIGAAYVFRYNGAQWVEEAKLVASDGDTANGFGKAMTLGGDTVVIGAPHDDEYGARSGAAYVFQLHGVEWREMAKLPHPDGEEYDRFGTAVTISDNFIVVGANGDDDYAVGAGAAYCYQFDGAQWVEHSKLHAADAWEYDVFGNAVAIADDTLLVGASDGDGIQKTVGSVYVFRWSGIRWVQQAKRFVSDWNRYDDFGRTIAIQDGDRAVIGANGADGIVGEAGAAYVFDISCRECLNLQIDNMQVGQYAEFQVSGGTPGARAVTVFSQGLGQTSIRNTFGYCATFGINQISQSKLIGDTNQIFDADGIITFQIYIPRPLKKAQLYFQSAQHGTCPDECISNVVRVVVH